MTAKSDFGKAVADEYRLIKQIVAERAIDRSVKEQVTHDIDRMIEHHEDRKPFPPG